MVPKLIFLIQATILSLASSTCIHGPFPFCNFGYIESPFWGGTGALDCGHRGFRITCDAANGPLLNISLIPYKLLLLDFSSNTLKVERLDLAHLIQNTACSQQLLPNTTLNPQLFKFPPNSTDRNLTLFLDCSGKTLINLPNQFRCKSTVNVFTTADASAGPGAGVRCKSSIFVPINQDDALSLEDPTASSVNIFRSALSSGFYIQWLNQSDCGDPDGCVPRNSSLPNAEPPRGLQPVQRPGNPPQSLGDLGKSRHGSGKGRGPAKTIALVVALTVTALFTISITVSCFLRRRPRNTPNQECKQEVEDFLLRQKSLTPKRFRYSEIKKITKSFSDKLGQGGYGSVYKGMLSNGSPVAVKLLIETNSNGEEFINEVASISGTSHVNIVTLLGFCYEGNRRALVYEFMPNNSLDKFLNHNPSPESSMDCCLGMEKLFKIAVGTARGLEYLHAGCKTRMCISTLSLRTFFWTMISVRKYLISG